MTFEKAINVLQNTAWLGSNRDREEVEEAIQILSERKALIPKSAPEIVSAINQGEFTSQECRDIFLALSSQYPVLGGKLWLEQDVLNILSKKDRESMNEEQTENFLGEVSMALDASVLDDCTDQEWNAIVDAICQVSNFDPYEGRDPFDDDEE